MPILNYITKTEYNRLLKRFYDGCDYLEKHPKQFDKYYPELMKILDKMNYILKELEKEEELDNDEIQRGFILN